MSKEVAVTFQGQVDRFGARIDDKVLTFNNGKTSVSLAAGTHFLTYFVIAPPGSQFTIAIMSPPESAWSRTITVPADGVVIGSKKFVVNQ